jgi:SAM-dependent methyltransferase
MLTKKACALPGTTPPPSAASRLRGAATAPLTRYLSRQASRPSGLVGRTLGRIWIRETAAVNDVAVELLEAYAGDRILEIGFGPGRTVQRLAEIGAEVDGVDVSPDMLCLAARRNASGIARGAVRLHAGDGTRLPATDGSLDAVVGVHTVYFWPDPAATAAEIARALRPGGRVVLAFRDGAAPLSSRFDPSVYDVPTVATATAWLVDAGLTDVTAHRRPDVAAPVVWLTAIAA